MIDELSDRVNSDENLVRRGAYLTANVLVHVGEESYLIEIEHGRIVRYAKGPFIMPDSTFSMRASANEWEKFLDPNPKPGSNDLFALMRRGELTLEGDLHPFMSHLRYFKEMFAKLRERDAGK